MTCAGRSRSRSLALPVSARTRRTSSIGNVLAITPRLMWSLRRTPAGRPAGTRAIAVAHPRASASMAQPHLYVNGIGFRSGHEPDLPAGERPDGVYEPLDLLSTCRRWHELHLDKQVLVPPTGQYVGPV